MKTGAAIVGMLFSAAIGVAVGYSLKGAENGASTDNGGGSGSNVSKLPVGNSYAKGPKNALVTIVEFSDFQCPFCSRVGPTLKQIHSTYGKKVRVVFKHQPLPFHKDAPLASEYALAAGEQGKFWEMHDKLFANQKALKEDSLKGYAKELGLDMGKVQKFIASGKGKKAIAADQALANKVGARGTPAFYINGEKVSGAQPFANFKKVIDAQLARAEAALKSGVSKKDLYGHLTKDIKEAAPKPQQRPKPQPLVRQKVELVSTTPFKGGKTPLVTIVEYSDFQCPFCTRVNPTLAQVMKEYGDDVQIRFRNQPLSFHKRALPAAKAALAAGEQGKYWEMHDKLFANQKALEDADLDKYAKELGLNISKFKADMASDKIAKIITADQQAAAKVGARGTPTLFANGVPIKGAQPFANFKSVIDKEIALAKKLLKDGVSRSNIHAEVIKREGGKTLAGAKPAAGPAKPKGPVKVDIGNAPTYGSKNAKVKIVVFSDFECPFCGRVNPSIEEAKKTYGDKISVSFKQFPLPFHPNAKPAAIASLAAHRQGKFWEMHDKLFANQKALKPADLESYATDLGLDMAKFKKDMADPVLAKQVDADMAAGQKIGVRGTPASFVNGIMVSGAQPFAAFKNVIDQELKK